MSARPRGIGAASTASAPSTPSPAYPLQPLPHHPPSIPNPAPHTMGSGSIKATTVDDLDHPRVLLRADLEVEGGGVTVLATPSTGAGSQSWRRRVRGRGPCTLLPFVDESIFECPPPPRALYDCIVGVHTGITMPPPALPACHPPRSRSARRTLTARPRLPPPRDARPAAPPRSPPYPHPSQMIAPAVISSPRARDNRVVPCLSQTSRSASVVAASVEPWRRMTDYNTKLWSSSHASAQISPAPLPILPSTTLSCSSSLFALNNVPGKRRCSTD
jgi:hypothetical protein